MKIKILQNFNGNVNGESWKFVAGEEREVPDQAALEFVRGHYAMRVDMPAVKVLTKPVQSKGKLRAK